MWFLWLLGLVAAMFGLVVFRGAPYLPTKKRHAYQAFSELYPVGDKDVLVDIGSGDGVVLREAAKRGARGVGYELNPVLVVISKILCRHYPNIKIVLADYFFVSLPHETTVVYVFGESRDITKMARKVAYEATRLNHPLFFISYGFKVAGYEATKTAGAHYLYRFEPLHNA